MHTALGRLSIVGYFLLGTVVMIFPPLMASAMAEFELSLASLGLFFPAKALGGMFGGFFIGLWSDLVGRRWIVFASTLALGIGLFAASTTTSWTLFLVAFMLAGVAQSAVATVVNALAADVNTSTQGKGLNILHGVYGLGAAVGPLAIAWMLGAGTHWRTILLVSAVSWLLFGIVAAFFPHPKIEAPKGKGRFDVTMFKHEVFLLLFIIAFVYNGVSLSLLGWVSVYLQQSGIAPFIATSMISLFYLGMTVGRFACAAISERSGYAATIMLCALGTVVTYPLVVIGQSALWLGIGVLLSGLFVSGLYPTALAYGSRTFPALAGTVTGGLSVAMTLGAMLPPWWTGLAAEAWSFQTAVGINFILVVPLIWVAFRLRRDEQAGQSASEPGVSA